jgi:hypothetical protein
MGLHQLDGLRLALITAVAPAPCVVRRAANRYPSQRLLIIHHSVLYSGGGLKSYGDWGSIFADNVIASDILDPRSAAAPLDHDQHQG